MDILALKCSPRKRASDTGRRGRGRASRFCGLGRAPGGAEAPGRGRGRRGRAGRGRAVAAAEEMEPLFSSSSESGLSLRSVHGAWEGAPEESDQGR
eukprot:397680-Pyramimonas_sp.AAC.1